MISSKLKSKFDFDLVYLGKFNILTNKGTYLFQRHYMGPLKEIHDYKQKFHKVCH